MTTKQLIYPETDSGLAQYVAECNAQRCIVVYRIHCTRAYRMDEQGSRYALAPWGRDTEYYEGSDDGGVIYRLPDGYTVGLISGGYEVAVWDDHGKNCSLTGKTAPHLQSLSRSVALQTA